jgi:hypothetical protein
MLSWIFLSASSLRQQSVGRHVIPLGHIILILSQPVFVLLLNAACLAEKQQILILVFGLNRTRGVHATHYTTNAVGK